MTAAKPNEISKQTLDKKTPSDLTPRDRRVLIAHLAAEGQTLREIGRRLGISAQRVSRIARGAGIPLGRQGGTGLVSTHVPFRLKSALRQQAEAAGVSVSAYVARVLKAVCEDATVAKRTLGRDAMPVRAYRKGAG
ncbi:sigma factor-like helix-turn-helix DNA-binding protein [Labrys sp. La1]|uniref:sigma factor-like helix-turn-helix DNA-binding protein n=1 Tax=Labrys sp. La1 TaxID=3404917 RepID=UPI003EB97309